MENKINRSSLINHAMVFGIEIGIWLGLSFVVDAWVVSYPNLRFLSFFLSFYVLYGVYRSAMHYKVSVCEGVIRYGHAMRYIVCLFAFGGVVAALIRMIYLQWINSDFLSQLYSQTQQIMEQIGMPIDSGTQAVLKQILTPIKFSIYYIFNDLIHGVLWGLILAIIVVRKKVDMGDNNQK